MTKKIVPHERAFHRVNRIGDWNNGILIFITCVAILSVIFEEQLESNNLSNTVDVLNSIGILAYFILDMLGSFFLQKAETLRRLVFIDNSFGVNLVGKKSEGYFTNESLSPGVYKMAVNCFENVFFSHAIASKMLIRLAFKNIPIAGIFIVAASLGEAKIVNLIFQLSLPILLFQQLFKLLLYVNSTERVLENFRKLFSDLNGNPPTEERTPEILRNIIHYEANISWGSIPLTSSLFSKFNDELSAEWNLLKVTYKI